MTFASIIMYSSTCLVESNNPKEGATFVRANVNQGVFESNVSHIIIFSLSFFTKEHWFLTRTSLHLIFSLELKHKHAVNICALASGQISTGREMLFVLTAEIYAKHNLPGTLTQCRSPCPRTLDKICMLISPLFGHVFLLSSNSNFYQQDHFHTCVKNVEVRRSYDRLISTMEFSILQRHLYIE